MAINEVTEVLPGSVRKCKIGGGWRYTYITKRGKVTMHHECFVRFPTPGAAKSAMRKEISEARIRMAMAKL